MWYWILSKLIWIEIWINLVVKISYQKESGTLGSRSLFRPDVKIFFRSVPTPVQNISLKKRLRQHFASPYLRRLRRLPQLGDEHPREQEVAQVVGPHLQIKVLFRPRRRRGHHHAC